MEEENIKKVSPRHIPHKEIVSLFPYQIKRRENFYFRDHPVNLPSDIPRYRNYWMDELKSYVEGRWVNDEGTWVYMHPKLNFFVNYSKIYDEDRRLIFPRLRDIEWIIFTYFFCMDGFSGFEEDEEYTCHYIIKELEDGKQLTARRRASVPNICKKKDGTWKKYVEPWHYLTRHYLLEHPAKKPLGLPLYDNPRTNGLILSGRGMSKSLSTFVGDFGHELLTGGIKRISDLEHINVQLNFGMGCADSRQLDRSIANIKTFYENMPGKYEYPDGGWLGGPFYKVLQGTWKTGGKLQHVVKRPSGPDEITGSLIQMVALTPDKTKVGAGDRFRRIYIEEIGFLCEAFEVYRANKDSMKVGQKKVGSFVGLGTGGNLKCIQQSKTMHEKPEAYDIFGIPNYWKNPNKRVSLFIPAYYASEDYKDKEGNTIIKEAYDAVIKYRDDKRKEIDAESYESEIMFNPIYPDEIFMSSDGSVLPRKAASEQLDKLETYNIFRNRAIIGDVHYNPLEKGGVEFKKDLTGEKKPILKWESTAMEVNSEGAVILYEQPPERIPEGLYYVIFDPVARSGTGSSYNSVLVYKNFYRGPEDSVFDTIVAEWLGRKERLEDNYHMVIKIAKYYNARIFPETNIAGFVEWCNSNNFYSMLESDATYFLKEEVNPKMKRDYYKVGFQMNDREKQWALRKLRDWLLEYKRHDPVTGLPLIRTIDWIFSPRILEEIRHYSQEEDENFDHISSLLGLMILIGKLGKQPIDLEEEEEIKIPPELKTYYETLKLQETYNLSRPARSKFLSY